jgi:hypothetical protein
VFGNNLSSKKLDRFLPKSVFANLPPVAPLAAAVTTSESISFLYDSSN